MAAAAQQFGYKALRKIRVAHEGRVLVIQPGEEVPAHGWKGAAVDAMIENGKIARYVVPDNDAAFAFPEQSLHHLQARIAHLEAHLGITHDEPAPLTLVPSPEPAAAEGSGAGDGEEPDGDLPPAAENDGSFPRRLAGGFFELSDGSKVRGKPAALKAQAELDTAAEAAENGGEG